jgi:hypothetical protein
MSKPSRKTIRKRIATRRRNAGIRRARRRKTAEGRLSTDGAYATENIGRRLRWLAHEWKIPADRLPKVKCVPTEELSDFVQTHNINWNWLLSGDLKGLRNMMWARKGVPTARQLSEKIRSLPPDLEKIVREKVDRLLAEQAAEESEPA